LNAPGRARPPPSSTSRRGCSSSAAGGAWWCEFGPTEIFANYRHDDPGSNAGKTVSANINFWQAGVIQKFEKADLNLYMVYQFADGSFIGNAATAATGAPIGKTEIDGFQEVITGAKINF
jgi:hypothetical protein